MDNYMDEQWETTVQCLRQWSHEMERRFMYVFTILCSFILWVFEVFIYLLAYHGYILYKVVRLIILSCMQNFYEWRICFWNYYFFVKSIRNLVLFGLITCFNLNLVHNLLLSSLLTSTLRSLQLWWVFESKKASGLKSLWLWPTFNSTERSTMTYFLLYRAFNSELPSTL